MTQRGHDDAMGARRREGSDDVRGPEQLDRAASPALSFFSFCKLSRAALLLFSFLLYLFRVPRHIPKEEFLLGTNKFI